MTCCSALALSVSFRGADFLSRGYGKVSYRLITQCMVDLCTQYQLRAALLEAL